MCSFQWGGTAEAKIYLRGIPNKKAAGGRRDTKSKAKAESRQAEHTNETRAGAPQKKSGNSTAQRPSAKTKACKTKEFKQGKLVNLLYEHLKVQVALLNLLPDVLQEHYFSCTAGVIAAGSPEDHLDSCKIFPCIFLVNGTSLTLRELLKANMSPVLDAGNVFAAYIVFP
eukprot:1161362-Pelagomonas_calceolata.AAC.3